MKNKILTETEFAEYFSKRFNNLLSLCLLCKTERGEFNQQFLGLINLESTHAEEILDLYGSMRNSAWYDIREIVAGIKNFSQIGYNLIHISHALPGYSLLTEAKKYAEQTEENIKIIKNIFKTLCTDLITSAQKMNIPIEERNFEISISMPLGKLSETRKKTDISDPGTTIVHIATSFLNLTEDEEILTIHKRAYKKDYKNYFNEPLNETRIRNMENNVHNLQATYDTALADTNIEDRDSNLRILRGHISTIFHLLEIGTILVHYYERHMACGRYSPTTNTVVYHMVIDYTLYFSEYFLQAAKELCRSMIKEYGEQGEISVTVPQYRGFHVRPSTLVAKIVQHYASDVEAELSGQCFDVSSPMELFRANELINAYKRDKLYKEIDTITEKKNNKQFSDEQAKEEAHRVFLKLLRQNKIIIFNNNFGFDELTFQKTETLAEFVKRGIAHSLALGDIDIPTDMKILFRGDKRVLADLKILAENGYGEDKFGNNTMLPKELSYLKR